MISVWCSSWSTASVFAHAHQRFSQACAVSVLMINFVIIWWIQAPVSQINLVALRIARQPVRRSYVGIRIVVFVALLTRNWIRIFRLDVIAVNLPLSFPCWQRDCRPVASYQNMTPLSCCLVIWRFCGLLVCWAAWPTNFFCAARLRQGFLDLKIISNGFSHFGRARPPPDKMIWFSRRLTDP